MYEAENGKLKIDVRLQDETVWLTQQAMAELFQSSKQNVSHHINSIYEENELVPEATVKKYLTVRKEGERDVSRLLDFYNLDMIISIGYRIKSGVATRFRQSRLEDAKYALNDFDKAVKQITHIKKKS